MWKALIYNRQLAVHMVISRKLKDLCISKSPEVFINA